MKQSIWISILEKFAYFFYLEYEKDTIKETALKYQHKNSVKSDQTKTIYDSFCPFSDKTIPSKSGSRNFGTTFTLAESVDLFKRALTEEELNSINFASDSEEFADVEEHDTEKFYRTVIISRKP